MRGVFVTGTDTDVGKTVASAALLRAFPRAGYLKPVQTGCPPDDDRVEVLRLAGAAPARAPARGVRLRDPVSPHEAARREGTRLSVAALVAEVAAADDGRPWVVEGAGGLLVPLSEQERVADLVARLALPVVLAVRVRLGAINATLLTLEALAARHLALAGLVLLGPEDRALRSALEAFAPQAPWVRLPWLAPLAPATLAPAAAPLADAPWLAAALA